MRADKLGKNGNFLHFFFFANFFEGKRVLERIVLP